jgi:hypothetical protein
MTTLEIVLKNGVTVRADVSRWKVTRAPLKLELDWETPAEWPRRQLVYVDDDDIAAIVADEQEQPESA